MSKYETWTVGQLVKALQKLPEDMLFTVRLPEDGEVYARETEVPKDPPRRRRRGPKGAPSYQEAS